MRVDTFPLDGRSRVPKWLGLARLMRRHGLYFLHRPVTLTPTLRAGERGGNTLHSR